MLSNPVFFLAPSPCGFLYLLLLAGSSILITFFLPVNFYLKMLLIFAIMGYTWLSQKTWLQIYSLQLRHKRRWQIVLRDQTVLELAIAGDSVITPWFMILRFKKCWRVALIPAHTLSTSQYRQLAVLLRFAPRLTGQPDAVCRPH